MEKVLREPVLFDGQKLARAKSTTTGGRAIERGVSFEEFSEAVNDRRQTLIEARAARLLKTADRMEFKNQAASVEVFLEKQLRTQEEVGE